MGRFALGALAHYDVFHLYFGNTLLPPPYPDLLLLRALGKRIIFHFCGCEVREREVNLRKYSLSGCIDCVTRQCLELKHPPLSSADELFVATPDLLEFAPGAHLLPGPVDLSQWTPKVLSQRPVSKSEPVRIVHAPTDRHIKGTRYLVAAVERLKSAGYALELDLLEGLTHKQVQILSRRADIAVDQLMMGAYGTFSIEMMAMGLPVVCRIRPELRKYYPIDLPLVTAEPGNIYEVLESLITQPGSWGELGVRGIRYVQREHEMHRVAERALALYGLGLDASAAPAQDPADHIAEVSHERAV